MECKTGTFVRAPLMVNSLEKRVARNKNHFLYGRLQDKDGDYAACIWDARLINSQVATGDVVQTTWSVKEFNGSPQLDIKEGASLTLVKSSEVGEELLKSFIRTSSVSKEEWLKFYREEIEPLIEDPSITKLINVFLGGDRFWSAPAAKAHHHYWIGGLSEHTYGMLRLYKGLVSSGHPLINLCRHSVAIAGIVLHDWAKCLEYKEEALGIFSFSKFGSLVGHIPGVCLFIVRVLEAEKIKMPRELQWHLFHVVLAHHGTREWGSPVAPVTREAILVHYIDNIDAKMAILREVNNGEKCFSFDNKAVYHFDEKMLDEEYFTNNS